MKRQPPSRLERGVRPAAVLAPLVPPTSWARSVMTGSLLSSTPSLFLSQYTTEVKPLEESLVDSVPVLATPSASSRLPVLVRVCV